MTARVRRGVPAAVVSVGPRRGEQHLCACGCMCKVAQRTNREMVHYVKAVMEIEAWYRDHPERVDPQVVAIIAAARSAEGDTWRAP